MADILFHAHYLASTDTTGKTGLTPTIDIHRVTRSSGASSEIVTAGNMTETGDGLYHYLLSSADLTLYDYSAVAKTADTSVTQKHVACLWTLYSMSWHDVLSAGLTVAGSIGKRLVDYVDAAISGRAAAGDKMDIVNAPNATGVGVFSAANWNYTSRTLTSFGTLVADVWGALTSALTGAGTIGKALADLLAVFNATTRTLTQTAAQVAAATAGPDLTVTRYTTFTTTLTGMTIPADWDVIWLTAKRSVLDLDVDSQIMIRETNGGAATDGLRFVNRTAATATQYAFASLTVNQGAGSIVVTIQGDGTVLLRDGKYHYDIKCLRSDADDTISQLAGEAAFDVDSSYTVEID